MATLDEVACRHPQTTYVVLQKSLQHQWAFVQDITPDIGMAFQVVEDALQDIFLPPLFQRATSQITGRAIIDQLVKQAGIALLKPTWTAGATETAS